MYSYGHMYPESSNNEDRGNALGMGIKLVLLVLRVSGSGFLARTWRVGRLSK